MFRLFTRRVERFPYPSAISDRSSQSWLGPSSRPRPRNADGLEAKEARRPERRLPRPRRVARPGMGRGERQEQVAMGRRPGGLRKRV